MPLEGTRHSPASRGTASPAATEQSAEPTPSLAFLLQICKFKGWHIAVIKPSKLALHPEFLQEESHLSQISYRTGAMPIQATKCEVAKLEREIKDPHVPTSFMTQQLMQDASEVT